MIPPFSAGWQAHAGLNRAAMTGKGVSAMKEVLLQIPTLEAEQSIEIDVRINGKRRTLKYRVEIIDLPQEDEQTEDRVDVLRHVIAAHDKDWELIQIGAPIKDQIPITFRKKGEVVSELT
jgi:hypothetical protein